MFAREFKLGEKCIGNPRQPFIIAEVGSNFNQDIDIAKKMIKVAAACGADSVKFQSFDAHSLYPTDVKMRRIFEKIRLDPEWLPELKLEAEKYGLVFMSSAFDFNSLSRLEDIDVVAHKVASSELTNHRLVAEIIKTKKPTFISTGMADFVDVCVAVDLCRRFNHQNVVFLQCGSVYPLSVEDANLSFISTLKNSFDCIAGFSDHTGSDLCAILGVGLGASVFEKHFTLNKYDEGPDHFYALDPCELKTYVESIKGAASALGSGEKSLLEYERETGRREGLAYASTIEGGTVLASTDLVLARPLKGLPERYRPLVVGSKLSKRVIAGQPVLLSDFDD